MPDNNQVELLVAEVCLYIRRQTELLIKRGDELMHIRDEFRDKLDELGMKDTENAYWAIRSMNDCLEDITIKLDGLRKRLK